MTNKTKNHTLYDGAGYLYTWASIAMVTAVCLFIIVNVFNIGMDAISWKFLTTQPDASALNAQAGGILTPMIGTVLLTLIGIAISLPLSLCTAIYLRYYAKKGIFKDIISTAIDILASVPTVVIALFALAVFTMPFFTGLSAAIENTGSAARAYGRSFLVSGITMSIMILPFVTKSIEEALKTVPETYLEASYSLGATKWLTITKVALFSAREGITTGTILGMGRIIGDTAIVWLTLGGSLRMTGLQPWWQPQNWLSTLQNTGCTLTSYIYYTSPAGEGNRYDVAFGASLVLIVIILLLNFITALIGNIGKHRTR